MGRSALIGRLLVWALAIVAIDGLVIATHDGDREPATSTAQATTTTSTTTSGTAGAVTESTDATTGTDGPSATDVSANPASTTDTSQPTAETTIPTPGANDIEVARLQGDGETTQSIGFNVTGKWELRWHVESGANGVAATVEDNQTHGTDFIPLPAGDDSQGFDTGCDCTLHLVPDGSAYDVRVVDVEG